MKRGGGGRHVPPKRRLTLNGVYGITSQNATSAVRTSYPVYILFFFVNSHASLAFMLKLVQAYISMHDFTSMLIFQLNLLANNLKLMSLIVYILVYKATN
jgi:hypothetical protein